jgi:hypothetical protein
MAKFFLHLAIVATCFSIASLAMAQPNPAKPDIPPNTPSDKGAIIVPPKTDPNAIATPPKNIDPGITEPTERIDKKNRQESQKKSKP